MKKAIWIIVVCLSITSILFAQEMLVNGTFDNGLDGWTHFPLMDGNHEGEVDGTDDGDGPAMGSGPYLWMFCEGTSYMNQCIYQPIIVQPGDTFDIDGAFKDMTGGELNTWWMELYVGFDEPIIDTDYPAEKGILNGFKTWDGCAAGIDGTFKEDGCVAPADSIWIAPNDLESDTVYFMIKTGIYPDNADPILYEVAVDEMTMVKRGGGSAVNPQPAARPTEFILHPNFPNPFNPSTTIRFALSAASEMALSIYDVNGRLVRTLMHETLNSGTYSIDWDGLDSRGNAVPSGVYLCQLKSGSMTETQRMILMK
ncbi:T9SS type A sorting domain-containing protein [candidate division KSB1 bacterium]|nr:T9SS type A sorting domain-containing protein [candidate division KSB1 bacterium]